MAARQLAAAGFRTAILDKKKVVGEPVQCAEGVSEFGLESNGLRPREEWIAQRVSGAKCGAPNGDWFYITRLPGYAIDRPAFDRWIVEGAVADGADLGAPARGGGRPDRRTRRDGGLLPEIRDRHRPPNADDRRLDSVPVRSVRPGDARPRDRRRCGRHHESDERRGDPSGTVQRAHRGRMRRGSLGERGPERDDG